MGINNIDIDFTRAYDENEGLIPECLGPDCPDTCCDDDKYFDGPLFSANTSARASEVESGALNIDQDGISLKMYDWSTETETRVFYTIKGCSQGGGVS